MRFLFAIPHSGYMRNFESTLRLLAERGNRVIVAIGSPDKAAFRRPDRRLQELAAELPGLIVKPGVERTTAARHEERLARRLRSWLDYMRYFDPYFETSANLRKRAAELLGPCAIDVTRVAAADPAALDALRSAVATIEAQLPVSTSVSNYVADHGPDAVIVSPLMEKGSPQTAYVRAAHRLGVPCALCVASWDNMTTSGLIHGEPDLVIVWNDLQHKEAVRLHGVAAEHVAVVGAPLHDVWFETGPATSRAEFCARVGLPDDRPYILYVGSSPTVAPMEESWAVRWAVGIRGSAQKDVTRASLLVRPHPHNPLDADVSARRRLESLPGVAIHPARNDLNDLVMSNDAHQDYFDSIHHAAAVVGVNTSAMIESAIVGRGVHVLRSKRFRDAHEGRPHFEYLVSAGGGLLRTAETIDDHVEGLARALRGEDRAESRQRANHFLRAFVRPRGLDIPATPLMVDALESLSDVAKLPARSKSLLDPASGYLQELEKLVAPAAKAHARLRPARSRIRSSPRSGQ